MQVLAVGVAAYTGSPATVTCRNPPPPDRFRRCLKGALNLSCAVPPAKKAPTTNIQYTQKVPDSWRQQEHRAESCLGS